MIPFTKAEIFYIKKNAHIKEAEEIAADLNRSVEEVQEYLRVRPQTRFDEYKGVVSMTPAQSAADDEAAVKSSGDSNHLKRLKDSVHVFDPEKPVQ